MKYLIAFIALLLFGWSANAQIVYTSPYAVPVTSYYYETPAVTYSDPVYVSPPVVTYSAPAYSYSTPTYSGPTSSYSYRGLFRRYDSSSSPGGTYQSYGGPFRRWTYSQR